MKVTLHMESHGESWWADGDHGDYAATAPTEAALRGMTRDAAVELAWDGELKVELCLCTSGGECSAWWMR